MRKLRIAAGTHRTSKTWRNKEITWPELVKNWFGQTTRTKETIAEYKRLAKDEQDRIKDVGGFVGGWLRDGRRKKGQVLFRELVTLDADFVEDAQALASTVAAKFGGFAYFIYSTHKHTPEAPRLRIILPLAESVSAEEYPAVARMLAKSIGIDMFDPTTYEPERLMYWPSTSVDGEFYAVTGAVEDVFIDPRAILAQYKAEGLDPKDASIWPRGKQEGEIRRKSLDKLGDPREKPGVIGAFCRAYSISAAIATFLPEVYSPCDIDNRYTYVKGSTSGGLIVYDNLFAYSHHGTDPVCGLDVNSFDLVRLHKFGKLDIDKNEGTPISKLPSQKKMEELAAADERTHEELIKSCVNGFDDEEEEVESSETESVEATDGQKKEKWQKKLKLDGRNQKLLETAANYKLILQNDKKLKDCIGRNLFSHRRVWLKPCQGWPRAGDPQGEWNDDDDACLRNYMDERYGLKSPSKIKDALREIDVAHAFHPVRDFIKGCEWDGIERADTLFIDYLGAADTPLNRAITHKQLLAAVKRVFEPGCKYDQILTLVGPQGIGKSSLLRMLSGGWFTDSLVSVQDYRAAVEQLLGAWIIEMAELQALRKADAEQVKQFISKQSDKVRLAYAENTDELLRQCVFFGTTNNYTFLKDPTGNRRFWPCEVGVQEPKFDFTDFKAEQVKQIWAEAYQWYLAGETLYLDKEGTQGMRKLQDQYTMQSDFKGVIEAYLEEPITADWYGFTIEQRRDILEGGNKEAVRDRKRDRVCVLEIWSEALGRNKGQIDQLKSREISDILQSLPAWKRHPNPLNFGKDYGRNKAWVREAFENADLP